MPCRTPRRLVIHDVAEQAPPITVDAPSLAHQSLTDNPCCIEAGTPRRRDRLLRPSNRVASPQNGPVWQGRWVQREQCAALQGGSRGSAPAVKSRHTPGRAVSALCVRQGGSRDYARSGFSGDPSKHPGSMGVIPAQRRGVRKFA